MTDTFDATLESGLELQADLSGIKISDQERQLANQAHVEFESQNYEKCLEALDKLSEIRQSDHKVIHNKAVAQFYQGKFTKTDEFYKNLISTRKQAEHQLGDDSDVLDMAYLLYNEAVVCYNMRQYNTAVCTLNRLFNMLDPLDESLALKVCFLLAEIYLILYKPDKAGSVLNYIENLLLGNGKTNEQDSALGNGVMASKEIEEALKTKLHQFRARQNLQTKSMKGCKREIKEVMNSNSPPHGLFLKSNFELLRQNYKKTIKLLNSAPKAQGNVLETGESLNTMYFNNLGFVHFHMRKYNLAAFYSRLALEEDDKSLSAIPESEKGDALQSCPMAGLRLSRRHSILYNLGIQLLFSGRPQAAFDCLVESLQTYHTNARLWLRLAECCILSDQLTDDNNCKCSENREVVRSVIGSGPHRKIVISVERDKRSLDNESQSAAMPACTLEFSSICLQNALLLLKAGETLIHSRQETSSGLENHVGQDNNEAIEVNGSVENDLSKSSACSDFTIPALPGPPIKSKEIPSIRCAMLCCSAYVSLGLGDNVTALEHAHHLLEQTNISGSHKFLGHLYAAESLIKLNRISEAITHLSCDNIGDIGIDTGGSEKSDKERDSSPHYCQKTYYPQSLNEGKATILYNLASTYCLRSEYDKAKKCLAEAYSQGSSKTLSGRMILLAIYIELQCGNTSSALQIIKKNKFTHMMSNGGKSKHIADYWKS